MAQYKRVLRNYPLMGFRGVLAQWYGEKHGYTQRGGHIFREDGTRTRIVGWMHFYKYNRAAIWNEAWPPESSTGQAQGEQTDDRNADG